MANFIYNFLGMLITDSSFQIILVTILTSQIPPVKELRKVMRIQALRCHVIYCQNGTKLNVIPVLASRSQALRYTCRGFLFLKFAQLPCFFVIFFFFSLAPYMM
jgi:hypothetical protein